MPFHPFALKRVLGHVVMMGRCSFVYLYSCVNGYKQHLRCHQICPSYTCAPVLENGAQLHVDALFYRLLQAAACPEQAKSLGVPTAPLAQSFSPNNLAICLIYTGSVPPLSAQSV